MDADTPIWNSMVSPKTQESINAAYENFHKMNSLLNQVVEHDIPTARDISTRHKKAVARRKKRKNGGHK